MLKITLYFINIILYFNYILMLHLLSHYCQEPLATPVSLDNPQSRLPPIVDMLLHLEQARSLIYRTAWEYDQEVKAGSKLVSSLGFNLCVAAWHNLDILFAGHATEVFGGRAALKDLPVEGFIRTAYGISHGYGTSNCNLIKSMSMI
jgi:hypothetical protein